MTAHRSKRFPPHKLALFLLTAAVILTSAACGRNPADEGNPTLTIEALDRRLATLQAITGQKTQDADPAAASAQAQIRHIQSIVLPGNTECAAAITDWFNSIINWTGTGFSSFFNPQSAFRQRNPELQSGPHAALIMAIHQWREESPHAEALTIRAESACANRKPGTNLR